MQFIVKLVAPDGQEFYLEWSSIVDGPVTVGMSREHFERYYRKQYGELAMDRLPKRLTRAEKYGTSSMEQTTAEEMLTGNRAGPDEANLTMSEIIDAYCLRKPIRDGWKPFRWIPFRQDA